MDASARASSFLQNATVVRLRDKLAEMGLATTGAKAVLKSRLSEAIGALELDQIAEYFPVDDDDDDEEDVVAQRLDRLREMVRKKEEILSLEKRLAELNSPVRERHPAGACSSRDIEDSLPSFSGDDDFPIKKWMENVEEAMVTYHLSESEGFIYFKRLLKGTARLFLRSKSFRSWSELKAALMSEFHHHTTATDVHNTLRNRKKRKDENYQQYVLVMQEIASSAEIDEQDVIAYIIKGIPDSVFNKQVMLTANTIAELKAILRKYEKMKADMQPTTTGYSKPVQQTKPLPRDETKIKCYNCNETGHMSTKCPKPRREKGSCFRCGKKGHVVTDCPQKTSVLVVQNREEPQMSTLLTDFHGVLEFEFETGGVRLRMHVMAIIDTGSPISFIQQQYVPPFMMTSLEPANDDFVGVNNSKLVMLGKLLCSVNFNGSYVNVSLYVVCDKTMQNPIVLGRDFLQKTNVKLMIEKTKEKSITKDVINLNDKNENDVKNVDDFSKEILKIDTCDSRDDNISLKINENLCYEEKVKLKSLVFGSISTSSEYSDNYEMKIILTNANSFFNCAPRRLPYTHKVELQNIIDELLENNIIRESNSPYASPIVLTRKKTGEIRLCIDFRQLNKITVKDNFPLPLIEDHLDTLRNKKYFSLLDLKSGFHHVKMAEDSIKFTSFVTPLGQFEYLRMPFGLKNAPSVFQRYINKIFKDLITSGELLIYIDDLLIATETKDEHFKVLKKVLEVVSENNLQLRLDKCMFLYEKIKYLGYEISANGIGPNCDGLKAVENFPIPANQKKLHSFLGLCSYFRKFIQDFSLLAKPLYDLIKKDAQFVFGEKQLEIFMQLKEKLLNAPLLSIYNPNADTELHCDASSLGFGAVLLQRQDDKQLHPIFFFSKRSTDQESRYHSYELETLAIIYALRRFRIYLTGIRFKIVTDCRSLTQTLDRKILNPRISRWALELQDFDYVIEHRDGKRMGHVDALSRCHNILIVEPESFEHALASSQQKDPTIKSLVAMLEKRESPTYELINGLVYRKINKKVFFYVPSMMERNVIQTHHENLCHLGVEKCFDFLRKTYWFPSMKNKIKQYIANCLKCVHFSPTSGKKEAVLHNIPKGDKPFETLHIDHYGPLPTSVTNKKKHIFVIVDGFSKYTKLYAVKSTTTKEVVQCLESYFSFYSKPSRIISDRGSCFTADDFSKFCEKYSIQHIKVATSSPQSNGQVERVNRCLTPMLSKESELDPGDWIKYLKKVEFALNNTENKSTGISPSMLLFGVAQKGFINDNIKEYLDENIIEQEPRNLEELRKTASEKTVQSQTQNKIYFDKRHKKPIQYKIGDHVLIKNVVNTPGINKKFLAKYKGPYEVVKILPNDRYLIKDLDNLQISRLPYEGVCCPENMKPYVQT